MSRSDGFFDKLSEVLKAKLGEVLADQPGLRLATFPPCSRQLYGPDIGGGGRANPFDCVRREINNAHNASLMACTSYNSECADSGDYNLCEAQLPVVCGVGPDARCDGFSCQGGPSCGGVAGFTCPANDISCDLFKCPASAHFQCTGRFLGCGDVYWEGGADCPSTQKPFQCNAAGSRFQCADDNNAFSSCTDNVNHFGCPSGYNDCDEHNPYMSCPGVYSCIGRYTGGGTSHCAPRGSFHCPNMHICDSATFDCLDHFSCATPSGSFECIQNHGACVNYPDQFDCTLAYGE